jgi:hypothetical protein
MPCDQRCTKTAADQIDSLCPRRGRSKNMAYGGSKVVHRQLGKAKPIATRARSLRTALTT